MSQEDAYLAQAILKRHGWEAWHYRYALAWHVTACWPPMMAEAHDIGAPDAPWYAIDSLRHAVKAVWLYSAIRQES